MKTSTRLLAAIALVAVGVGVMVSLRADRGDGEAGGKPTKSGAHRMRSKSGSPAATMADLRSASRGDLREWARGLEDGELRRLAMSFLGRLEGSTEPEEWEDRARMREFLAVLFMEWGKRDIGGVEAALKGADELMVDLAFPTALAGYSEREPMDALERLSEWDAKFKYIMVEPAIMVATFHLAKQDPEAAFEFVKNGPGSLEGLAAGLTGPGELDPVIEWLGKQFDDKPQSIFLRENDGDLRVELAAGWARHDLGSAAEFIMTAGGYSEGDMSRNSQVELWNKIGIARPQEAMDFVVANYLGNFGPHYHDEDPLRNSFVGAFAGVLLSDPDATLTQMIRVKSRADEDWPFFHLYSSGAGESENENEAWPLDDALLPLPVSFRNERIFSRLDEFGWSPEKEDGIRERIESRVKHRERNQRSGK